MDDRARSFIVTDEPLGLVPNDKTGKCLRDALFVAADPRPARDQHAVVVFRDCADRSPGFAHRKFHILLRRPRTQHRIGRSSYRAEAQRTTMKSSRSVAMQRLENV